MQAGYPQPCGWCGNAVADTDGWLLHGFGVCLLLAELGRALLEGRSPQIGLGSTSTSRSAAVERVAGLAREERRAASA